MRGNRDGLGSRLWGVVWLAIALAVAAHLLMLYVVPLLPYLAVITVVVALGYLLSVYFSRRRW